MKGQCPFTCITFSIAAQIENVNPRRMELLNGTLYFPPYEGGMP